MKRAEGAANLSPYHRPKSRNSEWEEPPQESEPFNYNATPSQFYISLESIGNIDPDSCVQQSIKVMQQKLAAVLQELAGGGGAGAGGDDLDGFGDNPRSPGAGGLNGASVVGGLGGAGGQTVYEPPDGFTTPYANPGATSAWGGGATPYGAAATPYRTNGWNA